MSTLVYDNSQLQEFKNCQYRYWLKYGEGYKKRQEGGDSHDRAFGTAIHAGLETHYKGGGWDDCKLAFTKLYPDQLQPDDLAKTQENGIRILEAYIEHYRQEDKKWKVLACEEVGEMELAPGIKYTVKIDLIVENLEHGGIYVVDHKTTGKSFDYRYWAQFEPNSQLTGYCAYAEFRFGACSGAFINGIRLGHRQRAYKGEPAGFYYEFQRQLFNRNQKQINDWKQNALGWIEQLQNAKDNNRWLKNEAACTYCQYRPICIPVWDPRDEADRECIEIQYAKVDPKAYLKATPDAA